jgi:hypothetical protein
MSHPPADSACCGATEFAPERIVRRGDVALRLGQEARAARSRSRLAIPWNQPASAFPRISSV